MSDQPPTFDPNQPSQPPVQPAAPPPPGEHTQQIPQANTQQIPQAYPAPQGQQPQQPGPYGPPPQGAQYGPPPQGAQYGQPQGPQYGQPPVGPPPSATGKSTKRIALVAAGVLGLALIGGGGAFAFSKIAQKGSQPDSVIPSTAVAYLRVDTDPSAGQKVALVQFLQKFPQTNKVNETDFRKSMWDSLAKNDKSMSGIDYATDIEPWLGDRAAAAVLSSTSEKTPDTIVVIATKDEAKAKTSIESILAKDKDTSSEVVTKDGFALIVPKGRSQAILGDLGKGSLATNSTYTSDMSDLGETGVASLWYDGRALADLAKNGAKLGNSSATTATDALETTGHGAAALRFDSNYVELAGIVRDAKNLPKPAGAGSLGRLPDDTVAALQISGLGDAFANAWPQLSKTLGSSTVSDIEDQTGLTMPDDAQLLLGKNLTVTVPPQDFANMGTKSIPLLGVISETTDGAKAKAAINGALTGLGAGSQIPVVQDGNTLYVATDADYADALKTGGNLGKQDLFGKAVRDADKAQAALFVNLDALEPLYLKTLKGDQQAAVKALAAVGISVTWTDTSAQWAMRVVAN